MQRTFSSVLRSCSVYALRRTIFQTASLLKERRLIFERNEQVNWPTYDHRVKWPTLDNPWIEEDLGKPLTESRERRKSPINYEVSKSEGELKWLELLEPQRTVPPPPQHSEYPTPSGWVPVRSSAVKAPYFVHRTRFHNFPIYFRVVDRYPERQAGKRCLTEIRRIDGDICQLERDLRAFLETKYASKLEGPLLIRVHQVSCKLVLEGNWQAEVCEFVTAAGF